MTIARKWSQIRFFILPEGPGAQWREDPYVSKGVPEGMIKYRLTLHGDVVCLTPDGGERWDPVPIEPRMTWDEAVAFLSRCAVAPPVKYNREPWNSTSISFVLAPASEPWHKWTGYDPGDYYPPEMS